MGTKWGEGKTRVSQPRVRNQMLAAKYLESGGDVVKAAKAVHITPGAAKKSLASMRGYIRQIMGERGLTYQGVLDELYVRAHNSKNEVAAIGGLKALADHLREIKGEPEDDLTGKTLPEIIDMMDHYVREYRELTVNQPPVITMTDQGGVFQEDQNGAAGGVATGGTEGDGGGDSPETGRNTAQG